MAEQMKPSGIDWIGDVPANWYMIKLKYFSYLKGRIGWQGLTVDEFIDEGPYLITGTDFENGKIQFDRSYHISDERYNQAPEIQLKVGDLLVTKDGTVGKMAYVDTLPGKASLNSHLLLIRPLENKFDNRFLFWLMSSSVFNGYTEYAQDGTVMASLSQEKIGNFIAYFPEITEQQAVADFLDKECAQIDSIAADLEKQIALLQQYKKSLITETVTKGLDKSVPMKDSGVEWIGEIPEHWEISRVRHLASLCSGATPSKDVLSYWEGNIPWVSSQEVKSDIIKDTSLHISEEAINSCSTQLMPAGTLVMVVRSGILQHTIPVALLGVPATINQDIKAFQFNHLMLPAYFKYYIQGENDALLSVIIKDKTTVESVDNQLLLSLKIMVPPIEEQKAIVAFLNYKCGYIDKILNDKQEQLNLLMQHKKSLIYEYVTGKKRVKEVR